MLSEEDEPSSSASIYLSLKEFFELVDDPEPEGSREDGEDFSSDGEDDEGPESSSSADLAFPFFPSKQGAKTNRADTAKKLLVDIKEFFNRADIAQFFDEEARESLRSCSEQGLQQTEEGGRVVFDAGLVRR